MHFDPFPIVYFAAILLVKLSNKPAGRKPRRIHGKILLNTFERQTAQRHELREGVEGVPKVLICYRRSGKDS
jgi:hypothetical protein